MYFRLLGAIEVSTDRDPLALGGPRSRAVLADLALHAGETVPTAALIADLWGELPPPSAGHTLETYVYRLRRVLHASDTNGTLLASGSGGYRLAAPPQHIDVYEFRALVARGRETAEEGDATAGAALLREALALWRGPALADIREAAAFAHLAAAMLEDERLAVLETLGEVRLRLGQHRELVGELEVAIAGAPYRESFHSQLMLALYRSGRQAEALAVFRRARELLVGDLGIEPGREMRNLEQAILRQAPELELASGGAIERALRPLPARQTRLSAEDPSRATGAPRRRPLFTRVGRVWRWAGVGAILGLAGAISLPILLAAASSPATAPADGVAELTAAGGHIVGSLALSSPPGAEVSADGSVWVTSSAGNAVYRIDPASASIVQTIPVGSSPSAITAADGDIWVANTLAGTVSRISASTNEVVETINVGAEPTGIAFGSGSIWVADAADSTLEAINPVSGDPTSTIALDAAPFGLTFGAGSLWVTSPADDSVTRVDPHSTRPGQEISVGSGPTAIVFGLGSAWVANSLDSTVSRVDPTTDAVAAAIPAGDAPDALTITRGSVWVGDRVSRTLTRIDAAKHDSVSTISIGAGAAGLSALGGHIWIAATATGRTRPTGGTLRVLNSVIPSSVDPAVLEPDTPPPFYEDSYDTLVAYQQTGGSGALQLVPDLAIAMPTVTGGGTEYTFTLRPGLRYSDGQLVRPKDFRYGIERALVLDADTARPSLLGIVGAAACRAGRRCDLKRGVIVDDSADTVTFHLVAPQSDFLYDLANVFTAPTPPGVPARHASRDPVPGTGPYAVVRLVPGRQAIFERNPYFREWSAAAQPQGSPNRIVWTLAPSPQRERTEIETGKADWTDDPLPSVTSFQARFPNQVRVTTVPALLYAAFNTKAAPFNDPRVRRAFSLAADRSRLVSLLGGPDYAAPTCQILPPGVPGYKRYCPFSVDASPSGVWVGPDLAAARRLVAASGTTGMRVTVWTDNDGPVGPFMVSVLRELGYTARLHHASFAANVEASDDSRRRVQATSGEWWSAEPSASAFFDQFFRCSDFRLGDPADTQNGSFFCDPPIDRLMNRADSEQLTDPTEAAATWTSVDRAVTDAAPWVGLAAVNNIDFLSARVTNYQFSPYLLILLDQLQVRQ